jgi:hypothetical protein
MKPSIEPYPKQKVKVPPNRPDGPEGGGRDIALLFPDLGARRGGWSAPRPSRFTPGKDPVPTVQEAGWVPETVWTCAKNLAPIGIRFPDRPARGQSLYRLSYHDPPIPDNGTKFVTCSSYEVISFLQATINYAVVTKKTAFCALQCTYKLGCDANHFREGIAANWRSFFYSSSHFFNNLSLPSLCWQGPECGASRPLSPYTGFWSCAQLQNTFPAISVASVKSLRHDVFVQGRKIKWNNKVTQLCDK